ncbi:MAG: GTP-binding protein [Lewinellaceae bacterium]|nr:GTP-binding protein [Lewinellaceae bacterium]
MQDRNIEQLIQSVIESDKNNKELDLSNFSLSEIPQDVFKISKLEYLNLDNNSIKNIPDEISNLKNLRFLSLKHNEIENLSKSILNINNLSTLELFGNPLINPPIEVVDMGLDAIKAYFEELENFPVTTQDEVNEIKLVLVGNGGVGKTSLIKSILDQNYQVKNTPATTGIEITKWKISKEDFNDKEDFIVNIWDFGGQEIYHSTHQLFLTQRSLYLLLIDSRSESNLENIFYWLNIIKIFGGNSPVLLVNSKIDEYYSPKPIYEIKSTFHNVIDEESVSCLPDYRHTIENLKFRIKDIVKQEKGKPEFKITIPKNWISIKENIEIFKNRGQDFLEFDLYWKLCQNENLSKYQALNLSNFFHDLGFFYITTLIIY